MNKLFSKTVKKLPLLSVILAVIVAAAIVVTCLFGANYMPTVNDAKTLTVSGGYFHETSLKDVEKVCEDEFEKEDLKVLYKLSVDKNGVDRDIVYYFALDADLSGVKDALQQKFNDLAEEEDTVFSDTQVSVTVRTETLVGMGIPASYLWRALLAVGVFAVLAFVYVALRYRLDMGIATACGAILSALLAASVILLTRIPLTASSVYPVALSSLITVLMILLHFNKLRKAMKEEEGKSAEELVVSSMAIHETLEFFNKLEVALVLVGVIATDSTRWFVIVSLVSLIVSALISLVYVPALYLPMKKATDKRIEKNAKGYKGAKKSEKKAEEVSAALPETQDAE